MEVYPLVTNLAVENGPVEIVSCPMKNGEFVHSFLYVYQKVTLWNGRFYSLQFFKNMYKPVQCYCLQIFITYSGQAGPAGPADPVKVRKLGMRVQSDTGGSQPDEWIDNE